MRNNGAGVRLFTALFCIAVLSFGCAGMQEQKQEQRMATVELEGNPTTGYSWVYAMSPEGVVREVSNDYIPDTVDERIVGSGGKFIFTFESVAAGEAEIIFSYRRSWERDIPALRTVIYMAIVDDKNNLTLTEG
jgi:predicted secreted protein